MRHATRTTERLGMDSMSLARSPKLLVPFCVTTLLSLAVFATANAADAVTKKSDGKKVIGTIVAMSKNDVTIKRPQGEEIVVPLTDIGQIDWDGGVGELNAGYNDEKKGRYDLALQRFQKAKSDAKSPSSFLQGEFEYIIARVVARQALVDSDKRDQALQKLIAAQKTYPDHVRFYESVLLLTQLQLAAKDFEGARKSLEPLRKSNLGELKFRAMIVEGRVLAGEGNLDESIAQFAATAESLDKTTAEMSLKQEALIGQTRGLIAKNKFEEALKILQPITERQGPADDSLPEAEAYLLQGQALRGLGRNKEAILSYLYVDIIFAREADFHAEALYQLVGLWKQESQPDRSTEAAAKLTQLYPKSEWRKKLAGSE